MSGTYSVYQLGTIMFKAVYGDAEQQYVLACLYFGGEHLPHSPIYAYAFYSIAADKGHVKAKKALDAFNTQLTSKEIKSAGRLKAEMINANPQLLNKNHS